MAASRSFVYMPEKPQAVMVKPPTPSGLVRSSTPVVPHQGSPSMVVRYQSGPVVVRTSPNTPTIGPSAFTALSPFRTAVPGPRTLGGELDALQAARAGTDAKHNLDCSVASTALEPLSCIEGHSEVSEPSAVSDHSFDAATARRNVDRMWALGAEFGMERSSRHIYLEEIVSDRYSLVFRFQLIRDELQLAADEEVSDLAACRADFSIPSVLSTVAKTNCGDRIHQGEATSNYIKLVASRFAAMTEVGDLKMEAFNPTGGGTDDGATLAHVTVAHHIDAALKSVIYSGNNSSFVLSGIDLQTHVGRLDDGEQVTWGCTKESSYRCPRASCGAIVGTLGHFNHNNQVHRRIRGDLGEWNYEYLTKYKVKTEEGNDITSVVAAAIVCIQGMENTLKAMTTELDERGMAHLTASITVNRPNRDDTLIYLARGTVFDGELRVQGLGLDAAKYGGKLVQHGSEKRLVLTYDGHEPGDFPIRSTRYYVPRGPRSDHSDLDM